METTPIQDLFRMTQERLLANRIMSVIGKNGLSYETTPARVFLETLEQVITKHREEFGDPIGRDISERKVSKDDSNRLEEARKALWEVMHLAFPCEKKTWSREDLKRIWEVANTALARTDSPLKC